VLFCVFIALRFRLSRRGRGQGRGALWSHIQVLADDNMEGRSPGSEGHRKAAQYVAGEYERAGLKPAGTSGYLQPVKFDVRQLAEDDPSLALIRKGNVIEPLTLGDDATIGSAAIWAANLEAPAVFVGYGLVIPENEIDDLAGLDLKGKIAVYLKPADRRRFPAR